MKLLLLLFFFSLPVSAVETTQDKALAALFAKGAYDDVMEQGRAIASARGYTLAARAALTKGGFLVQDESAVTLLHAALVDIEKALLLDPDDLEARLTAAMAIGFEAKRRKTPALGKTSRHIMEKLAADFPDNQIAVGSLGGWHSEVSAAGFMARLALGARVSQAHTYFEAANALNGDNIAFLLEYSKFLARRSPKNYARAISLADRILAVPAESALDRLFQEKTKALKEAILSGKTKRVKKTVVTISAFHDIKKHKKLPAWDMPAGFPLDKIIHTK